MIENGSKLSVCLEHIEKVLALFKDEQFSDPEIYVEMPYATEVDGKHPFNQAFLCKREEVVAKAKELNAQGKHVSMAFATKRHAGSNDRNYRHGKKDMASASAMGLDVDGEHLHMLRPNTTAAWKLIAELDKYLPSWIKNAVRYIEFTGGGLLLIVEYDQVVYGAESIERLAQFVVNESLKIEALRGLIDSSCDDQSKGQRLAGTYNPKAKYLEENGGQPPLAVLTDAKDIFTDYTFTPLDTAQCLDRSTALEAAEKTEAELPSTRYGGYGAALKDRSQINEIKSRVRIADIYPEVPKGHEHDSYVPVRCPNKMAHKNGDTNPSATLIRRPDGTEVVYCHVERKTFDLIAVAMLVWGLALYETVCRLAERCGIPKVSWDQKKADKRDLDAVVENYDYTGYLKEIGVDLNNIEVEVAPEGRNSFGMFILRNVHTGLCIPVRDREILEPKDWGLFLMQFAPDTEVEMMHAKMQMGLLKTLNRLAKRRSGTSNNSSDVAARVAEIIIACEDEAVSDFLTGKSAEIPEGWEDVRKLKGSVSSLVCFKAPFQLVGQPKKVVCYAVNADALHTELKRENFSFSKPEVYTWLHRRGFQKSRFTRKGADLRVRVIPVDHLSRMANVSDDETDGGDDGSSSSGTVT